MSIIQNIRERGTWILLGLIALALIAFILQDGVGRNNKNSDVITLGVVNGTPINKIEFEQKVQSQLQQYAAQGAQRGQVINDLWNTEVFGLLIKQEAEKIGLSVGAKEVNDVIYGPESPFRQSFTDPTTGEFKVNDLKTQLAELKKSTKKEALDQKEQLERSVITPALEKRILRKYQALLYRGIQAPKWLLEKQYAENSAISNIRFVNVPYTTIADTTIKVSNEEVAAYLKENSASFQIEEAQRNISFVAFSAAPSAADSASTKNNILALKDSFQTSKNAAAYLNKVTPDTRYYDGYLSKNRIQIPEKEAVLSTPIGGLYGPYVDGPNYTIAKVIGTRLLPDSASVRHILIMTTNAQNQVIREDGAAKILIDSIKNAIAGGAQFETMVEKYSEDGGSKANGGIY